VIVTVGGISVDITTTGTAAFPVRDSDGVLSRFTGGRGHNALGLRVTWVAGASWDEVLTPEDSARVSHIARTIKRRFPFTGVSYENKTGPTRPVEPGRVSLPGLSAYDTGDVSVFPHPGFIVTVDHRLGQATALVMEGEQPDEGSSLIAVLQAALGLSAPDHGALMLHAASLVVDGGGYLFAGSSGAGKTTVSGSVPRRTVLSDDGSWCGHTDAGFSLFPTPFSQIDPGPDFEGPAPLRRILFLQQGPEDKTIALSPGRAMTMLLLNHIHFFRFMGQRAAKKAFDLTGDICERHPISTLVFTRDFDPTSFFGETIDERQEAV